ncbi:Probable regulatory protein embR [Sarcina ventriculi]|uniref:FHA domain-containing protein n=1 Tax=Sarcina ventriculi TaxID=1267 RepID=UPI000D83FED2|nr:FHA domain-containing protein [Sarcina ventriculi]SPZ49485.1 Probable regulatory protein embR [Sarcina ventriculi]
MDFDQLAGLFFGVIFIIVLYSIILYALRIMYKDIKGGKRKTTNTIQKNTTQKTNDSTKKASGSNIRGLEVLTSMDEAKLKVGSVIPMATAITLGRKENNTVVLNDRFVSSYHAKIYLKNREYYLEDLQSTNGTYVNENKIEGNIRLNVNDIIRFGSTAFKVIG